MYRLPPTSVGDSEIAPSPAPEAAAKDPFVDQKRFAVPQESPDVARIEFELYLDRVYRVRWALDERFERPLMPALVDHLSGELGAPYYDQLIEGKFGTGRATLRRAAWRIDDRNLEVRQLNPAVGGPIYLTLSDLAAIRQIVAAGETAAPEPDSIGPWWQKPVKDLPPLSSKERRTLLDGFDAVLAGVGWVH
jgi:hypothetical protein